MERLRCRLEVLAQVTSGNYGLSLKFAEAPSIEGTTLHIEEPNRSLERIPQGAGPEALLRYQKGMTLLEAGHLREGSLPWARRALREESSRPGFFRLWHALEDARVENRLVARFPGARKNLHSFVRRILERVIHLRRAGALSLGQELRWGIYLLGIGCYPGVPSREPRSLSADWLGSQAVALLGGVRRTITEGTHAPTPREGYRAAEFLYRELEPFLKDAPARATDELPVPQLVPPEGDGEYAEGEGEGAESAPGQEVGEGGERALSELEARSHWAAQTAPGGGPWFELEGHPKEVHPSAQLPDERTIVIPPEGRGEEYEGIIGRARSEIKVLLWKLTQLIKERSYTRYGGRHRSGKLNEAKLWQQRLGNYRLFQRREMPHTLDVAFTLLVDESGSMNRESKYLAAREATVFFAEVLDRLDVPFEIIGYSTESSEAAMAAALGHIPAFRYRHIRHSLLQHRIYKSFEDPYPRVKTRLVNIHPRFNNWDEEHLLFAYRRLSQRRERERIIIITSDGQPNGDATHLVHTVRLVERLGVKVVGVGVVDPFVREIYPNHIVVEDLAQLSEELVLILRRELLGRAASAALR